MIENGEATRPGKLRWALLALLFVSTVINYLDRQALSILATTIQLDLSITDAAYAHIVQMFLFAYTLAYLLAGRITDWLGSRMALALFVAWWSVANLMTGMARSAFELGAARFALGLGEPGNYTVGSKVVSERFPPTQRGLALGIYTAGAMVGATLAPPLIGGVALVYGWRWAFVITGVAGLFWLAGWLWIHPREPRPVTLPGAKSEGMVWGQLLRDRTLWLLVLSRAVADPVWYFYLFWFPKYLNDVRGMTLAAVASMAWVVYLAADVGSVGGGAISSAMVKKGMAPARSRLIAMAGAAMLAPVGMLAAAHPAIPILFAIGSAVTFAHLVYQINISTLVVDLYPSRNIATVFGIIGAGSGLGGMLSAQVVGSLVTSGHFDHCFVIMAFLHPIAFAVAWLGVKLAPRSPATANTVLGQETSSA
ncbi:MFS transporter [Pinirhizobacter sp.]|jgi:ACS family hexuronate transporter-like MFS transporter|uniref:MFS transporter n=1 Tax=Pinirhizobacter sp. TaxID=2950432 RepID=UPI002F3E22CC